MDINFVLIIQLYYLDPVINVMLSSTNLEKSVKFWNGILGLKIFSQTTAVIELGFGDNQAKLKLRDIGNFEIY